MKFTIRDWFWLAIVVGLVVLWRSAETKLAKKPNFGTIYVEIDDNLEELKPEESIEIRHTKDGSYSVRRRYIEDSGKESQHN